MPLSNLYETYGPWAVVTGASSGIGAEFARQLAFAGFSVAIAARRAEKLEELSRSLTSACRVQVKVVRADLSTEAGVQALLDGVDSLDVGLLVNNAGRECPGSFVKTELSEYKDLIAINVVGFLSVAHAFARRFIARNRSNSCGTRRSGLIMLSSIARRPVPYFAVYSGTKAFVTSTSHAMRAELRGDRVDVLSLEPGGTASEISDRMGTILNIPNLHNFIMPTKTCVREGLVALVRRRSGWTPGLLNRLAFLFIDLIPTDFATGVCAPIIRYLMVDDIVEYKP